jgi:hypothetical protein
MCHLPVPLSGTVRAQKAPLGAAWRFFACEAVGKPVSRRCQLQIRISQKTPAPPGSRVFLLGRHGRLLTAGDGAELSTKAGSLQGYGLFLWYSPQDTALIASFADLKGVWRFRKERAEACRVSSLIVAQAAVACDRRHRAGFLPNRARRPWHHPHRGGGSGAVFRAALPVSHHRPVRAGFWNAPRHRLPPAALSRASPGALPLRQRLSARARANPKGLFSLELQN